MKIRLFTFKEGTAEVPVGRIYSEGANLKEEIGIQIGKSEPINSIEIEAPDDFFQKREFYKIKKNKISRVKTK